jgi:hypothetical protein
MASLASSLPQSQQDTIAEVRARRLAREAVKAPKATPKFVAAPVKEKRAYNRRVIKTPNSVFYPEPTVIFSPVKKAVATIPNPPRSKAMAATSKPGRKPKYDFDKLEVNACFHVAIEASNSAVIQERNVKKAAYVSGKKSNKKFFAALTLKGITVWRVL